MTLALLAVYFVWDRRQFAAEPESARRKDRTQRERLGLEGGANVLALGVVVASVALVPAPGREAIIVTVAGLSWWLTPRPIHDANGFTLHPILEVAALFAGIFVTLVPALDLLRTAGGGLAIRTPAQFFWATGVLSAFLDNAPTYLAFLAVAQGLELGNEVVGVPHRILAAISLGAVFFGANTYIGNARPTSWCGRSPRAPASPCPASSATSPGAEGSSSLCSSSSPSSSCEGSGALRVTARRGPPRARSRGRRVVSSIGCSPPASGRSPYVGRRKP
jgi:Na+/H+ antiporter NhaD/arsenite permease-like protein